MTDRTQHETRLTEDDVVGRMEYEPTSVGTHCPTPGCGEYLSIPMRLFCEAPQPTCDECGSEISLALVAEEPDE